MTRKSEHELSKAHDQEHATDQAHEYEDGNESEEAREQKLGHASGYEYAHDDDRDDDRDDDGHDHHDDDDDDRDAHDHHEDEDDDDDDRDHDDHDDDHDDDDDGDDDDGQTPDHVGTPVTGDGIVDGTSGDDLIDVAYTGDPEGDMIDNGDATQPGLGPDDDIVDARGGDDTILAGEGDDTVYAGSGDDSVEGGAGDDVIHGDSNSPDVSDTVREVFRWELAPDPDGDDDEEDYDDDHYDDEPHDIDEDDDLSGGFTLNTGNVDVTFSVLHQSAPVATAFTEIEHDVDGIDTGGGEADDESGLKSITYGEGNSALYQLAFSAEVTDVSFTISDIDGDGIVAVRAYDAAGNQIAIDMTGGSGVTLSDEDSVSGDDTADSEGGYGEADDGRYSILVNIAGPVARIEIEHSQDGPDNSGIIVSDVFFDASVADTGPDGDDVLDGGEGDDLIYGEGGDDTLLGGAGDDTLDGGEGDNLAEGGDGDDVITGGGGSDTLDGGAGDDSITGGGGDDSLTGGDGSDTVEGGDGDDVIDTRGSTPLPDRGFPGYGGIIPVVLADPDVNDDRDVVDGGAGDDVILTGDDADEIVGGSGDDTIDAGLDDDTVEGGEGADLIVGGEGADEITGGAGADTIYGGLDPAYPDVLNIRDDGDTAPADPDPTNGRDFIDGGDGDDEIYGQDDDDTLYGGAGDDYVDGGIDDDEIHGGSGDDTLIGDEGEDTVFGDEGDDIIAGGEGADLLDGGDDADTIGANVGDTIIGGEGGDDNDVLISLRLATVEYTDGDPASESGTVTFYNDDLTVAGTAEFSEIENVGIIDVSGTGSGHFETFSGGPGTLALGGVVEGTDGDDLIDLAYTGDPEGDMIDNGDAVLPGQSGDMDIVLAGGGDDTVMGENETDEVFGGAGDDLLHGNGGNDALAGGSGDDVLHGDEGRDILAGGVGDDTLSGDNTVAGDGGDLMFGGEGSDRFVDIGQEEVIYGGEDEDGADIDVLDLTGAAEAVNPGGSLTVEYDPGDPESGTIRFFDAGGTETGSTRFYEIERIIPCFTPGTRIATPHGERPVEDLQPGDRVITRDNGIQTVRWVGRRDLTAAELAQLPDMQPVLIRAGALGNGLPERDMLVSPNHRVLIADERTELYFEESEVLVAAKHLTGMEGIDRVEVDAVSYIHFMFDRHEVVLSDGAWTESFQPGDLTLAGMDDEQRNEILALFPELATREGLGAFASARRSLKKYEARLLVH